MEIPAASATHGFARSLPAKLERLADDNNNGLQLSKGDWSAHLSVTKGMGQDENTRSQEKKYQKTEEECVIVEGDSQEQPETQNGSGEDTSKQADSRASVAPEYFLDVQTKPFSYSEIQEEDKNMVTQQELHDATKEQKSDNRGSILHEGFDFEGPLVLDEIAEEEAKSIGTTEQDITTEQIETQTTGTDEQKQEIQGKENSKLTSYRLMLELRKYILLLASLVATATYTAGFSPPWGVWQDTGGGHVVGDPIILDTHKKRYLAFFYCNATAFAASVLVMALTIILTTMDDMGNKSSCKILGHYRNKPWISARSLHTVMIFDLLCLMGAYATGSSWDLSGTIYSVVLVTAVVMIAIFINRVVDFLCNVCSSGSSSRIMHEDEHHVEEESLNIKERWRKVLILLATFAVSTTYVAGFITPGGVWDTKGAGHTPGDAILKDNNNTRLQVFFYFNNTAFFTSVLTIVVLLQRKAAKSIAYGVVVTTLVSLVGSYTAGSSRRTDRTDLLAAVGVFILVLLVFAPTIHVAWKAIMNCIRRIEHSQVAGNDRTEKAADNGRRSLVLLLATLTATVTFQAGVHPPGGIWQDTRDGHKAGDPILATTNAGQYKAFFYCNSVAFLASLFTIALVRRKLLLRHYVLTETVMILVGLFGLIGAYTAGSFWYPSTSIYAMVMACGVLSYVLILVIITLYHNWNSKEKDHGYVQLGKTRKRFFLFATLVATITYVAGLTPPGGFQHQDDMSGHKVGHPVLLSNFPFHYKAFFYSNTLSFMMSICITVNLANRNFYKASIPRFVAFVHVNTAVTLFGLMGAFAAGSTQHLKRSIYVVMLEAMVLFSMLLLLILVLHTGSHTTKEAAVMETNTQDYEKDAKRKRIHAKRKYLMLLGILLASVTYKASLEPPGGAWKSSSDRYEAGNPIMHDIRRPRYLVFFYSNSISFVASIVIILLLLVQEKLLHKHKVWLKRWLVVTDTTIVLDLLGLLVAYAAGATRSAKTSIYFIILCITMPAIVVAACLAIIRPLLSIISKRSKSTQDNNQRQRSPPV